MQFDGLHTHRPTTGLNDDSAFHSSPVFKVHLKDHTCGTATRFTRMFYRLSCSVKVSAFLQRSWNVPRASQGIMKSINFTIQIDFRKSSKAVDASFHHSSVYSRVSLLAAHKCRYLFTSGLAHAHRSPSCDRKRNPATKPLATILWATELRMRTARCMLPLESSSRFGRVAIERSFSQSVGDWRTCGQLLPLQPSSKPTGI